MDGHEKTQPLGVSKQRTRQHPDIMGAGRKQCPGIAQMIISLGKLLVVAVVDLTRAFRLPGVGAVGRAHVPENVHLRFPCYFVISGRFSTMGLSK